MEERANGVELKIDLGLEGGVVVEGSSTEQPCSDDVVVQVGLERNEGLHEVVGILNDLGIDDLNTSNLSRRQLALQGALGRSSNGGADNGQAGNETGELHLDDYRNGGGKGTSERLKRVSECGERGGKRGKESFIREMSDGYIYPIRIAALLYRLSISP